jgi:putative transposase
MPKDFHLIIYVHHLKVENRKQSINGSYGKMLSSYARAIQNQENKTGSIFQKHTKFICLNDEKPKNYSNWKNEFGNSITLIDKTKSYPQICFDYIHLLPIHSQNISSPDEWEFSSYRDYQGLRNGKLVNFKLAEKELGIKRKVLD